ncbi:hypothetical protein ES703_77543 [subsurface metagenome]
MQNITLLWDCKLLYNSDQLFSHYIFLQWLEALFQEIDFLLHEIRMQKQLQKVRLFDQFLPLILGINEREQLKLHNQLAQKSLILNYGLYTHINLDHLIVD